MVSISEATIYSFVASAEHADADTYIEEFWLRLKENNPHFADVIIEHLRDNLTEDEDRENFCDGV